MWLPKKPNLILPGMAEYHPPGSRRHLFSDQIRMGASGGAAAVATRTFIGSAVDTTNDAASSTYSSQGIGTAAADRGVVVAATTQGGLAGADITGITISGDAMTEAIVQVGLQDVATGIFYRLVTTGTTADIVVSYNENRFGSISVYNINGANLTPTDTDTDDTETSNALQVTTFTTPKNGVTIGVVGGTAGAGSTWTWTNLANEDVDQEIVSQRSFSSASEAFASAQNQTITATSSGSLVSEGFSIASWGPA